MNIQLTDKMMYDTVDDMFKRTNEQRMARHKRSPSDTSTSTLTLQSAVQRFITSVTDMNDTIMVPCRLLDMEMISNKNKTMPDLLQAGQDPYVIYGLLNSAKNDLMYGLSSSEDSEPLKRTEETTTSDRWSSAPSDAGSQGSSGSSTSGDNKNSNKQVPARKISALSLMSLGSSTSSSDGDITEEVEDSESCVSSEESTASTVAQASLELRTHLSGLHSCLNQLSDTANFITERYQEELGSHC